MIHRLFTILSAISLLLGLLLSFFWFRSHHGGDDLRYRHSPWQYEITSIKGDFAVGWGRIISEYAPPEGWEGSFWPFAGRHGDIDWGGRAPGTFGFRFERGKRITPSATYDCWLVGVPYWFLCLPLLTLGLTPGACFIRSHFRAYPIRPLTILAASSLLICLLATATHFCNFTFEHTLRLPRAFDLSIACGDASFGLGYEKPAGLPILDNESRPIPERVAAATNPVSLPSPTQHTWLGFTLIHGQDGIRPLNPDELARTDTHRLTTRRSFGLAFIPAWFVILLTAVFPVWYLAFPHRRYRLLSHRLKHNLCLSCGYDLRASKDRCPECGSPIPQITNNE